ncbi:MAG: hypothetical protein ABSH07_07080 [Candidatus Dormibacteria bacterium]|jgi:hypothetical protein
MRSQLTLQINLAPTDLPHARWILPHQLRCWLGQVDEVVLTVDLHRSHNRYGAAWEQRLPGLRSLLTECCRQHPSVRTHDVDYSPEARAVVAEMFFGGAAVPAKDRLGAPFYSYFAGLAETATPYVLHMDSDMLYGGGSQTWAAEARTLMEARPDVLACNPLPGPPTADGSLRSQSLEREALPTLAFCAGQLSTRLFIIDMERLRSLAPLPLLHPDAGHSMLARLEGHPPYQPAEASLTRAMAGRGMKRIDFLGAAPGMWAIHPPFRSALFYERLPELVQSVEEGQVPEEQRGRHDMGDSMIDWSSARRPRWRRMLTHARLAATGSLGAHRRGAKTSGTPGSPVR